MAEQFCKKCGERLDPGATTCPKCGAPVKKGMSTCAIVGIVLGVLFVVGIIVVGILAAIMIPNFQRARGQGQYVQCQSNCKNIGTALEMYSTDNSGRYPDSLDKLSPDYLRVIPTCAAAGENTYDKSYSSWNEEPKKKKKAGSSFGSSTSKYTFYCSGHYHKAVGVGANYPQYNSTTGLVPR
ncbi:MAG: zinc-ribbon domain-containing protein [Candidatus Eremiobacteraeota bacterium]|nr:zinc-ribbon domain-containing protein [Candidatus Eremiobacteraeota bacterium]